MGFEKAFFAENVWVLFNDPNVPNELAIPRGCRVIRRDRNNGFLVRTVDGRESWIPSANILGAMHSCSLKPLDDMAQLDDLQEHTVLHNLHLRYSQKSIYTYIGTMLVAINPYESLPLYNQEMIKLYHNQRIGEQPPHVFAIADNAFSSMMRHCLNQSIVISGESGAGKTESTKFILQYLVTKNGQQSPVQQQILDANIILECFGNAKTVRNDNSSRFGKYIDVNFNREGVVEGAQIEHYLLEKSRIVFQNSGERNYHIFYSLLHGLSKDEKKRLDLGDVTHYNYLSICDKKRSAEDKSDAATYNQLKKAMDILQFSQEEIWDIFRLIAAILHMGNMKFKRLNIHNLEASELSDSHHVSKAADVLGVTNNALMSALTKRTILVQGERVVSGISKEQALAVRDTFVKTMYGKLFIMIVNKINNTIAKNKRNSRTSIGVLDIFGFENFDTNSFEQLCINYANESLQQFFVKHIFKLEQECYVQEGIDWTKIDFVDNIEVLDMIGNKYVNIFALIDEESKFPKGTDLTLLAKLHNTHGMKSIYLKPKSDSRACFGIRHFAGPVYYNVQGFLEKNRDSFNLDLKFLVANCTNKFVKKIFVSEISGFDTMNQKTFYTLASQFKDSLDDLMRTLAGGSPFFIRCIKPNELKKPNLFDTGTCVRQLRYSGLMDTAKVRKAGYPVRHTYLQFAKRYLHLIQGAPKRLNSHTITNQICNRLSGFPDNAVCRGKTKIFLKREADRFLEEELVRTYEAQALIVQNTMRMWLCRKRYQNLRNAVVVLKTNWKARAIRKDYLVMKQGVAKLQAAIRARSMAFHYKIIKKTIVMFQSHCRAFLVRRLVLQELLQKKQRMILAKKKEENIAATFKKDNEIITQERKHKAIPAPMRNLKSVIEELNTKQKVEKTLKMGSQPVVQTQIDTNIKRKAQNEAAISKIVEELNTKKKEDVKPKFLERTYGDKLNKGSLPVELKSLDTKSKVQNKASVSKAEADEKSAQPAEEKVLFIGRKLNVRPKTTYETTTSNLNKKEVEPPKPIERKFINAGRAPDRNKNMAEMRPKSEGAIASDSKSKNIDNVETNRFVDNVFDFLNESVDTTPNVKPIKNVSAMSKLFNTFRRPTPVPRKYKHTALGS